MRKGCGSRGGRTLALHFYNMLLVYTFVSSPLRHLYYVQGNLEQEVDPLLARLVIRCP